MAFFSRANPENSLGNVLEDWHQKNQAKKEKEAMSEAGKVIIQSVADISQQYQDPQQRAQATNKVLSELQGKYQFAPEQWDRLMQMVSSYNQIGRTAKAEARADINHANSIEDRETRNQYAAEDQAWKGKSHANSEKEWGLNHLLAKLNINNAEQTGVSIAAQISEQKQAKEFETAKKKALDEVFKVRQQGGNENEYLRRLAMSSPDVARAVYGELNNSAIGARDRNLKTEKTMAEIAKLNREANAKPKNPSITGQTKLIEEITPSVFAELGYTYDDTTDEIITGAGKEASEDEKMMLDNAVDDASSEILGYVNDGMTLPQAKLKRKARISKEFNEAVTLSVSNLMGIKDEKVRAQKMDAINSRSPKLAAAVRKKLESIPAQKDVPADINIDIDALKKEAATPKKENVYPTPPPGGTIPSLSTNKRQYNSSSRMDDPIVTALENAGVGKTFDARKAIAEKLRNEYPNAKTEEIANAILVKAKSGSVN